MENSFHLCVTTPEETKYDDEAQMVIMRCITGDMGIMANHEPTSAILDYGALRIISGETERRMAVFGGIAKVKDNRVTILANDAQWAEEIDAALARAEHDKLIRRLQDSEDDLAITRDHVLMRRTLVQIEVSTFPLVGGSASKQTDIKDNTASN